MNDARIAPTLRQKRAKFWSNRVYVLTDAFVTLPVALFYACASYHEPADWERGAEFVRANCVAVALIPGIFHYLKWAIPGWISGGLVVLYTFISFGFWIYLIDLLSDGLWWRALVAALAVGSVAKSIGVLVAVDRFGPVN